ncbi:hypothetical protein D3C81_1326610 [compost metagenome]
MGNDPQLGSRCTKDNAIKCVVTGESANRIQFVAVQPSFLCMGGVRLTNAEPIWRQCEILRYLNFYAIDVYINGSRSLYCVLDTLHPDPAATVTRQCPSNPAKVENFLHARRAEHRNHGVHHCELALVARA